ncbi:uracil-DNA glycosylase [Legionella londiniensis]|uniref:Uracil DNA glycosylase n=1 Tax=Legionella londiniensis TaxID=45068 RepID=A0A0W0VM47_9GAMM|nr:uracil-DNA glycosylase [Legionella londiniensis]KTD21107.1 uracil DNA glycosylase [Legionella londiniensis]STX93129.1 uracil-DNA glycosylase [Legionella londiniensis]
MHPFIEQAHPQWQNMLDNAMDQMDQSYIQELLDSDDWLPGKDSLFAAFSLPLTDTRYILMGESPYPREKSANGYAFWDNAVGSLWSKKGLSKEVNRATSLRNWIKMLLYARGDLTDDFSQDAIAKLDKSRYVQTADELFESFLKTGFLLLNATLAYSKGKVNYHARKWRPFIHDLLNQLAESKPSLKLILLGRIAQKLPESELFPSLEAEHPYNVSFITNKKVVSFFKPLDLLSRDD